MFSEIESGVDKSMKSTPGPMNNINQDRFYRLSSLTESRKVNLFYLKETILNADATILEKMDAMAQIRKNNKLPVFKFAIESVLTKFHEISEQSL